MSRHQAASPEALAEELFGNIVAADTEEAACRLRARMATDPRVRALWQTKADHWHATSRACALYGQSTARQFRGLRVAFANKVAKDIPTMHTVTAGYYLAGSDISYQGGEDGSGSAAS